MSEITQYRCWGWLGIASWLGIVGALASSLNCAFAQITPDGTLPNNSSVRTQDNIRTIEGGTTTVRNLFHSFGEFSVPTGATAYFNNALDIQNIISRVTGGSISNINGLIRANGTANLFLINPNGIVFGSNASLNIGGSFVASTANALQFGEIGFFSATDKNIPSPLLTINPSALLFNQINQNAAIQNNSVAFAGKDPAGLYAFGLRVPDGKSLLLVGGNVTMDGGQLNANGGRVELGGLTEAGTLTLGVDGDNLNLRFPENVAGDITLNASGEIKVAGSIVSNHVRFGSKGNGGNITIDSSSFSLLDGAFLAASTFGQGNSGNLTLSAKNAVFLAGVQTTIFSTVEAGGVGKGGNIDINAASLSLKDGAQLSASTFGQGNAGNVTVRALDAVSLAGGQTTIFSTVEAGGVGKGGNIDINAATMSLIDGAELVTITREAASNTQPAGRGDAGNVNINVVGSVDITGEKNGLVSGIRSVVQTGTVGNAGNITIDSGSFSLRNGAQIAASTLGQGNAGNVTVRAKNAVSFANGNIFSTVEAGGIGKGGNIDINAATLSLIDGASLQTSTNRASNTQPAGQGDAGNVNINVTGSVDIAGEKNGLVSGIGSSMRTGTVGNGGNITINSGSLLLRNRAQLSTSTRGRGNAGNVTVRAKNSVSLTNGNIFSTVEAGGVGKGGDIDINAATLSLFDGAQLQTLTRGSFNTQPAGWGNAGNVNVNVAGAVDIAGEKNGLVSGIGSLVQTGTEGNAGNITIYSGSFSLRNGTQLSTETFGKGDAGRIKVNAANFVNISGKSSNLNSGLFVNSQSPTGTTGNIIVTSPRVTLDNSGRLNAQSASGNGGNINLQTDLLLLRRGAQISTTAGTAQTGGDGGNINIDAPSGFIVAGVRENNDITANAFSGSGGKVTINATGIFGMTVRSREDLVRLLGTNLDPQLLPTNDITAFSQTSPTLDGTITLNSPDVDPNRGLLDLPTVPVDTEVAQACTAGGSTAQSKFVITGRGGLPEGAGEALTSNAVQVDLVTLKPKFAQPSAPAVSTNPIRSAPAPIVEATGWVKDANGNVVLTANASTVTPYNSWQKTANCRGFNS